MQNDFKVQVQHEDKIIKYQNIEYQLGQILGSGASAKVYRSKKFIDGKLQSEEVALRIQNRYFKPIYELLNKLKEFKWKNTTYPIENIPGGFLYTEYELFEGNLTQLGKDKIKENIFKIALTIAEALLEIHNSQYIHFDVKPDNIVFKINQQQQLKFALCDFSSIQPLENAKQKELFIEATPQFAPPEIEIQGYSKDTDQSSDIWSLGMSLYHLYSEKFMFTQDNLHQKNDQNFIDTIVNNDIQDDNLRLLIQKSLRIEKEQRLTAKEMIEQILNPRTQISQKQSSQNSQNIQQIYKSTDHIRQDPVKQHNLIKMPTLQSIIEEFKKMDQNNQKREENNNHTIIYKKQKQSCLLEMPN